MTDLKQEKEQLAVLENFFWQKKFSEALVLAEQLNKEFPHSFQINFIYVKILKEEKKWPEAESVLKQLMSSFPDNVSILKEWADVSFNLRNLEEAEKTYNKILFLDPFNVAAKEALKKLKIMVAPTAPATSQEYIPKPTEEVRPPQEPLSKGDTLPESYFEDIPVPEVQKPETEETPEESAVVKDYFEKTDDNINISLDDSPPPKEESLPQPTEDVETPPQPKAEEENDTEFATESAAQLYLSQGLYKEAISIYNKIFRLSRDERYLKKIEAVKFKMIGMKKIERLSHFLDTIKKEGEKFV